MSEDESQLAVWVEGRVGMEEGGGISNAGYRFSSRSGSSIVHISEGLTRVVSSPASALKDIGFRARTDLRRGLRMFSPARLTAASQRGSPDAASSSCQRKHTVPARPCVAKPGLPPPASRALTYPRNPIWPGLSGDQCHFVASGFQKLG